MNQATHAYTKPSKNIAQMAAEGGSFSSLAAALKVAGLLDTLADQGPFTVFAPTDEVFKKLPHGALNALMKDKVKLKAVMSYHIVRGRQLAKELKPGDLQTLEGGAVHIKVSDAPVEVNGARIMGADIAATNGVIHAIDALLMPKHVKLLAAAA